MKIPGGIVTERLRLRPLEPADRDAFVEFMTTPRATRYLTFDDEQRTAEGAATLFRYLLASYDTEAPVFLLAVTERSNGAWLGACGLSPLADEAGVECFFALLPRYWGWGYATEAIRALVYYAFEQLDLPRVVVHIPRANERARKVACGAGFVPEGRVSLPAMPRAERFVITRQHYEKLRQA